MWYNVDYNALALENLPTRKRKPKFWRFVMVLLSPIISSYDVWLNFRNDNMYRIAHNGQVCFLRKSLNDRFDVVQRRIYIGNGNLFDTTYIYTEAEAQDEFTNTESESEEETLYLRTDAETADTGLDFIVYVPEEIYNSQIHGLHSHIKYYRAGGKRYQILTIDE